MVKNKKLNLKQITICIITTITVLVVAMWILGRAAALGAESRPIPEGFGQRVYAAERIFEEMCLLIEIPGEWHLLIVPDTMHKACISGHNIYISYKFIEELHCLGELAAVIGHELAHIKLGHVHRLQRCTETEEAEADYWGYRYAKLIGFEPDVCALLRRNGFPSERIRRVESLIEGRNGILYAGGY